MTKHGFRIALARHHRYVALLVCRKRVLPNPWPNPPTLGLSYVGSVSGLLKWEKLYEIPR